MEDVKRMMTGARATFQSRMTFHYDFLLKTMQAGNLDWLRLMRQSYWYRRHEMAVEGCRRELARVQVERERVGLTEAERAAMEERDRLAVRLKESVNAARREAQKAWSAWENGRLGPRWAAVQKELWPRWLALTREAEQLERDLVAMEEPAEGVWPSFAVLERMGFLVRGSAEAVEAPPGAAGTATPRPFQLTPLGVMATEVNEGHEILMPIAYSRGLMKGLSQEEVLAVLAGFLGEGDEGGRPEGLCISRAVKDVFAGVEAVGREAEAVEREVGAAIAPRREYWAIHTEWVEPIWRWLGGDGKEPAGAAELCTDYGFYEGNLMRMLLKMVNLLEELRTMATLAADVDLLETMRGAELRLMRDVAVCDSLYLRI
jgi:superfamily II RNA helicase